MKTEALKLANWLENGVPTDEIFVGAEAASVIRKLVEELDKKQKEIQNMAMDELVRISQEWGDYGDKQGEPVARIIEDLDIEWTKVHDLPVGTLLYTTPQTKTAEQLKEDVSEEAYKKIVTYYQAPQTKPLSDEEIKELQHKHIEIEWFDEGEYGMEYNIYGIKEFARAIEERHGIK